MSSQIAVLNLRTRVSNLLSSLLMQLHLTPTRKPLSSYTLKTGIHVCKLLFQGQATSQQFMVLFAQWLDSRDQGNNQWLRCELHESPNRQFFYQQLARIELDQKTLGLAVQLINSSLSLKLSDFVGSDLLQKLDQFYDMFDQGKGHIRGLQILFLFLAMIEQKQVQLNSVTVRSLRQKLLEFTKQLGLYKGRLLPIQFKMYFIRRGAQPTELVQLLSSLLNILKILSSGQSQINYFQRSLQGIDQQLKIRIFQQNFHLFFSRLSYKQIFKELACIYGFQYLNSLSFSEQDIKKVQTKFQNEINHLLLGFIDIHLKQLTGSRLLMRSTGRKSLEPVSKKQKSLRSTSNRVAVKNSTQPNVLKKEAESAKKNIISKGLAKTPKQNTTKPRQRRVDNFEDVIERLKVKTKSKEAFR